MMIKRITVLFIPLLFLLFESCKKQQATVQIVSAFNYGDSVFYQKNQSTDYIISPVTNLTGKFISFPEGLVMDDNTGSVNISKSESGLKYRISFLPDGKTDTLLSFISISGINYLDGFYKLGDGDSIAFTINNAKPGTLIPGINNGSLFDIGSNCNNQGFAIDFNNGTINLAQTVRNGVFGSTPKSNDRHEFEMSYKINDQSNGSINKLKVKLYYFETMNDVTAEVDSIISSRQGTIIGPNNIVPAIALNRQARPRPACIFIVGR